MLYVKPDYYQKFKCTADKCEATCCAGWQIVIDEASLECYKELPGAYGEVLRERIDWEEGIFKQDARKRCAFLKADNLCDMFEHLGEDSLCVTCTNYPRHIEEFENVREITLSISCPEAASIILGREEPVTFCEEEVDGEDEEFEDFDPFFFSYLEDARKVILGILQNRSLDISVRAALVQRMAEEMQEIILEAELFELADVFEKYEDDAFLHHAVQAIEKELAQFHGADGDAFRYSKAIFGKLYELEHLSEEWEPYLEQCWELLYGEKAAGYYAVHKEFAAWCKIAPAQGGTKPCAVQGSDSTRSNGQDIPDFNLDIILEQLLVYFIFTYFCGAVYDDNIIGKVQMSLISVHILCEMFVAKWTEQHTLTRKDIERIVYRYSRELEHSDVNLELLEEARGLT